MMCHLTAKTNRVCVFTNGTKLQGVLCNLLQNIAYLINDKYIYIYIYIFIYLYIYPLLNDFSYQQAKTTIDFLCK